MPALTLTLRSEEGTNCDKHAVRWAGYMLLRYSLPGVLARGGVLSLDAVDGLAFELATLEDLYT